jgi:signal transduction histidine kinase
VATLVEREGRRVAAILHDEALSDDPELLRAVSAAAALALENARLQAELRARLDELKAAQGRIVGAADLERKRIERNLHDATQQRLTSVTLALGLADSKLSSDPAAAHTSLAQAKQTLAAALAELRDLSQDIHPNVLTEGGREPALEDLAYTTPLPVRVAADVNGRLPEQVEAGAYYVIAEALTNVAKHACASGAAVTLRRENGHLALLVRDDGVGGADPSRGSGLSVPPTASGRSGARSRSRVVRAKERRSGPGSHAASPRRRLHPAARGRGARSGRGRLRGRRAGRECRGGSRAGGSARAGRRNRRHPHATRHRRRTTGGA